MHQSVERGLLEELRERVERLPCLTIHFGGPPYEGVPEFVVRYKILSMIDGLIQRAKQ